MKQTQTPAIVRCGLMGLVFTGILVSGCTKEDISAILPHEYTVTASIRDAKTAQTDATAGGFDVFSLSSEAKSRVCLGDEAGGKIPLHWCAKDQFVVYSATPGSPGEPNLITLSKGAETPDGTFTVQATLEEGAHYCAYYPASGVKLDETSPYFTLAATQSQAAKGNSDHLSKYMYMSTDATPAGRASTHFAFNHHFALVEFNLFIADGSYTDKLTLHKIMVSTADGSLPFYLGTKSSDVSKTGTVVLETGSGGYPFSSPTDTYSGWLVVYTPQSPAETPLTFELMTSKGVVTVDTYKIPAGGFSAGNRYRASIALDMAAASQEIWKWRSGDPLPAINVGTQTVAVASASDLAWVSGVSSQRITGDNTQGVTRNFDGWTVEMNNDIDLSGKEWESISTGSDFVGTFDGKNHKIRGLTISGEAHSAGLFSSVVGIVRNLIIESGNIYSKAMLCGAIAELNVGLIENCHNKGCNVTRYEPSVDEYRLGGIVGMNWLGGTIRNCTNAATITGHSWGVVGGIVGYSLSFVPYIATIDGCENSGEINSSYLAGGIVGVNSGVVCGSTNRGYITASLAAGGIAAHNRMINRDSSLVLVCANYGTIDYLNPIAYTELAAGGIVGVNGSGTAFGHIASCIGGGPVYSSGGSAGAIAGSSHYGSITHYCRSTDLSPGWGIYYWDTTICTVSDFTTFLSTSVATTLDAATIANMNVPVTGSGKYASQAGGWYWSTTRDANGYPTMAKK